MTPEKIEKMKEVAGWIEGMAALITETPTRNDMLRRGALVHEAAVELENLNKKESKES